MKNIGKWKSGRAAWLLCLPVAACLAQAPCAHARTASLNNSAHSALTVLQGGLADGASAEESSRAGFKAAQTLVGLGTVERSKHPVVVAGVDKRGSLTVETGEYTPAHLRPATEVPLPAACDKKKDGGPGLLVKAREKVGAFVNKARQRFSRMDKAKKIALLAGLLAVEVAVILYPAQAVTVAVTGLGVLGLFGTTRELIATLRRRTSK